MLDHGTERDVRSLEDGKKVSRRKKDGRYLVSFNSPGHGIDECRTWDGHTRHTLIHPPTPKPQESHTHAHSRPPGYNLRDRLREAPTIPVHVSLRQRTGVRTAEYQFYGTTDSAGDARLCDVPRDKLPCGG